MRQFIRGFFWQAPAPYGPEFRQWINGSMWSFGIAAFLAIGSPCFGVGFAAGWWWFR